MLSLNNVLKIIYKLSIDNKIPKPYIVGGLVRDIYLKKEIKTLDLDITTNSPESLRLGILVANNLNYTFELSEDGHVTIYSDSFDIDFSSHFVSENVTAVLKKEELKYAEAFSRDFTINTLHQDLITKDIFDPTGKGIFDIENKIIRTPVSSEITLTDDPRRIYRAINFAVRYDFKIDDEIKDFVIKNNDLFSTDNIKEKYISLKLYKALKFDSLKTIKILKELNLFKNVPLVGEFKDVVVKNKMLLEYLKDV